MALQVLAVSVLLSMRDKAMKPSKRKFQAGEKILVGGALLLVGIWAAIGLQHHPTPKYDADMAKPEIACKSLVKAMLNQDDKEIKRLSTKHGYLVLRGYIKNSPFDSYPKLANRIVAEWGNSAFWEEDALMEKHRNETGFEGKTRTVKPGEQEPQLQFKLTPTGWKLDEYTPGPDRIIKRNSKIGRAWNLDE